MVELLDKNLKCSDCKNVFIFTKGEQEFYLKKAFSEPRRCLDCRKKRKKDRRKKRRGLLRTLQTPEVEMKETKPIIEKKEKINKPDKK